LVEVRLNLRTSERGEKMATTAHAGFEIRFGFRRVPRRSQNLVSEPERSPLKRGHCIDHGVAIQETSVLVAFVPRELEDLVNHPVDPRADFTLRLLAGKVRVQRMIRREPYLVSLVPRLRV
jgi:hypothetical protein